MFGQSLLSGAFGTALVPGNNFGIGEYLGNAATNTLGGKIKGAALFNGSNTGMVVPGNMGTLLGNEFSISFWFYAPTTFPSSGYPTFASLYGYPGYGSAYGWSIEYPNSGKIMFYWVSSSAVGNNIQSSTLTPGKWCHVIVTKDSNSANIYINNVLDNGSTAVSSNAMWYNGFEHFTIGCKQNTGAGGATASHISDPMDQLRIFTSVLTSAERAAVYAEDSSTANTLNFPTGAGCVAAYQFDNNINGPLNTDKISTCDFPSGAGCQLLYEFNNSVTDTCGSYNGTANNITYPNGVFNKAASFNGSSSYIDTNYTYPAVSTISISVWFNVTTSSPRWTMFGDYDAAGADVSSRFSLTIDSSNNFEVNTANGSSSDVWATISASSYFDSAWHHLVITADGTALKLYVDGTLLGSDTSTVAIGTAGAQSLTIGRAGDYNGNYMNGRLDQFRIFTSTLTQSQVTELARGAGSAKNAQDLNNNIAFNGFSNFKPDFVWNKATDQAYNHSLYDSIRGGQFQLASNTTNSQWTSTGSGGIRKFQDTGFTMGSTENANSVAGTNAVSWMWKAGADNYGGLFNGDVNISYELNNWLQLYDASSFSQPIITGSTDFGVSCWVKFHSIAAASTGVVGNFQTGITPQAGWAIAHQSGTPFQFWADGTANSNGGMVQATTTPVANRWYHVVGTYDGSNVKIYVNGTLENTVAYTSTPLSTASNFQIGRWYGNFNDYYTNGVIDQVRIFNSAPTQTEVTALYNESAGNNNTLNFPAGAGCIAAYTLNNTPNSVLNESDLATCNFPSGAGCEVLYQLNDNVTDTCGNHNGTATDITYTTGKFGKGVKFNGSTSKIAVSDPVLPNGACSISFWYNPSGATGSSTSEYILGCGGGTNDKGVTVYWYNQSFGAMVLKGSSSLAGYANGTGTFPTTDWYNVVFTWDGSTNSNAFKVYVNGVLNAQGTSDTSSASIGTYTDFAMGLTTSNPASGRLDQVRIFNTVLTQSQIRELNRGNYNLEPYGNFDPGTPAESYIKSGYLGRNNDGTIESQVSANRDYGFSIVSYNDSTGSGTVGHGLKSTPQLIIQKAVDISQDWYVYVPPGIIDANYNYLVLNSTAAKSTTSSTPPTATTFNPVSSGNYIAYVWHSVPKYSKIGSYTGNRPTTVTVDTGFEPAWIIIKDTTTNGEGWAMIDNKRGDELLEAQSSNAQTSYNSIQFTSTGFTAGDSGLVNTSGATIIYMAFAK